ncbi:hypothetical protein [Haloarcula amylovorans]|uniref:hypothetical protein n=1 Tax=Haloarcula amylovorans TaxID=2562280 RepID=UPI001075DB7C|nr:hypothetical protein [Halomicroarcula amylolytica]
MSDNTDSDSSSIEYNHQFTTIEAIEAYDWSDFDRRQAERGLIKPYTDPKILAYSYWIEELSQSAIGRRYGVTGQAVSYQMNELGVPTEAHPNHFNATLTYAHEGAKGGTYDWIWSCCNGERYDTYVHRLTACVENDPYEVFADNTQVHHETGHPLDNRPDALALVSDGEHNQLHHTDTSQWVIEGGEPRLRVDTGEETSSAVQEWWRGGDESNGDDYGLTVRHSDSTHSRESSSSVSPSNDSNESLDTSSDSQSESATSATNAD